MRELKLFSVKYSGAIDNHDEVVAIGAESIDDALAKFRSSYRGMSQHTIREVRLEKDGGVWV